MIPISSHKLMQQLVRNPLFRRGPSRHSLDPSPQTYPGRISWDYDRIEIIADGIIHATGISLGLVGAIAIIIVAVDLPHIEITSIAIYILGLVAMLVISAAYNMWPIAPTKWILRRFDHSAIYLLIAGTYMPFLAQMKSSVVAVGFGIGVWASAVIGVVLKLALPGRFDRMAIVLCLLLGWSGVAAYASIASALPNAALWLLLTGGALYSFGTLFHVWRRLRFHNAIWHSFVLAAASCHYSAVLACLARS